MQECEVEAERDDKLQRGASKDVASASADASEAAALVVHGEPGVPHEDERVLPKHDLEAGIRSRVTQLFSHEPHEAVLVDRDIFQEELREHYALDELWADAKIEFINELNTIS